MERAWLATCAMAGWCGIMSAMPRTTQCSVCRHPRLRDIHEAIVAGVSHREVGRRFGLDRNAIDRHVKLHMPQIADAGRVGGGDDGLDGLDVIDGRLLLAAMVRVHEQARALLANLVLQLEVPGAKVDHRSVVAALREVRQSLESTAKLNFEVADRREGQGDGEQHEAIDQAIVRALRERDVVVDTQTEEQHHAAPWSPPALPAG
jgi:hypothetical protein